MNDGWMQPVARFFVIYVRRGVNGMNWMIFGFTLITAYLVGSFPTALVYSRIWHGVDIRTLGDGNMGARNTKRQFGVKAGVFVALVDILKGVAAMYIAAIADLPLEGKLAAGVLVILGHDFPIFARFKGGQGFATTSGVFIYLFPLPAAIGGLIYGGMLLFTHNSDLAASLAMGQLFLYELISGASLLVLAFIVLSLLFVPLKQWIDKPRRQTLLQEHS